MKLNFHGLVDRRRLRREVRKYIQRAFNVTTRQDFLQTDCRVLGMRLEDSVPQVKVDAFIQMLQKEHNEIEQAETDSTPEGTTPEGTTGDMSSVQDQHADGSGTEESLS